MASVNVRIDDELSTSSFQAGRGLQPDFRRKTETQETKETNKETSRATLGSARQLKLNHRMACWSKKMWTHRVHAESFNRPPQGGVNHSATRSPPSSGSLRESCALRLPGLRPRHKVSPNTVQQREGRIDSVAATQNARTAAEAFSQWFKGVGCYDPLNALYGATQSKAHLSRQNTS